MLYKYNKLTDKQKAYLVKVFYKRKLVQPEKEYSYFFKDGVCEYAE